MKKNYGELLESLEVEVQNIKLQLKFIKSEIFDYNQQLENLSSDLEYLTRDINVFKYVQLDKDIRAKLINKGSDACGKSRVGDLKNELLKLAQTDMIKKFNALKTNFEALNYRICSLMKEYRLFQEKLELINENIAKIKLKKVIQKKRERENIIA